MNAAKARRRQARKLDPRLAEADDIRGAIRKMGAFDESLYDRLTSAKERGVLDIMHRVLDDDAERRAHDVSQKALLSRPLHVVIMDAFRTLRDIVADLSEARSVAAAYTAVAANGRAKYIGVLLILAALSGLVFLATDDAVPNISPRAQACTPSPSPSS
jgi:hypothetical protein